MYHIKPDKRSRDSAAEIVRGLEVCLGSMPLNAVTISDIHRATGISRSTIYRLFDTPEDILLYRFDQLAESSEERILSDPQRLLENMISVGMEQHEFLKMVIDNGRLDLIFRYTESNFRKMDAKYGIFPESLLREERDHIMSQLAMNLAGSIISWSRSGKRGTVSGEIRFLKSYVRILTELLPEKME